MCTYRSNIEQIIIVRGHPYLTSPLFQGFTPKLTFSKGTSIYMTSYFRLGRYTVLHIFRQVLFGAGNQGNHQNFEKSLLTNKLWHVLMGMKQKKIFFFEIFFSKWPTKKKLIFQFRQFSIFFCENFIDWSFC